MQWKLLSFTFAMFEKILLNHAFARVVDVAAWTRRSPTAPDSAPSHNLPDGVPCIVVRHNTRQDELCEWGRRFGLRCAGAATAPGMRRKGEAA